ncbi:MAG: 2-iminoacetate synthase ThiH [Spirochaetales bacterium]|nr:2-iminoacetate synthase ThiH [Leptospiraceae bacterium]MCP5481431.1 2-iminoacetate synthase ThiH [Spirochaetales bacterium]MCP5486025.1 2-iminoacetate synthase ThiH [Spirochaetales bacterium]
MFSSLHKNQNFEATAYAISGPAAFANSLASGRARPEAQSQYDSGDVEEALSRDELSEPDFAALLSPAADAFLERIAIRARALTRQRFGRTILLYAPLYLSNECRSTCTYCGFSYGNAIRRLTLSVEEAAAEAEILYQQGIRHILLLTGEAYRDTPVSYIGEVAERLRERFASVSIEVFPLREDQYRELRTNGVDGLAVYQETYDPDRYREVHLGGIKKHMQFRLECPDRAGQAGMRRIAIGALLGLSDPGADTYMVGLHARYLMRRYWQTQVSVSLPRLRPAVGLGDVSSRQVLADRVYLRYLCALRLFLPDAGLVLSTREPPRLRDELAGLVITQMSAGSRTEPGGYSGKAATEQFAVDDHRSVDEVRAMLVARELEPVFVDWSPVLK